MAYAAYTPVLQQRNTLRVRTPMRGEPPGTSITSACTRLLAIHVSKQAINQVILHAHEVVISPHLLSAWSAGVIDPRPWGFGSEPAHEYVVRTRLRTLRRIIVLQDAITSMRPAIWPAKYGDEHSRCEAGTPLWVLNSAGMTIL